MSDRSTTSMREAAAAAPAESGRAPVATTTRAGSVPLLDRPVSAHAFFRFVVHLTNLALLFAVAGVLYCAVRASSTQRYVDAFSDAIVPVSGTPEQKIQSILDWMAHPPARFVGGIVGTPNDRSPVDTLNYDALLKVCGTATNAFINLADTSDLLARRLLLVNANGGTKHVDAEVFVHGRWFVVDPTFHVILHGPDGGMLTRQQLADPRVFSQAVQAIPRYDPSYNFERTMHIRLAGIPLIGKPAGQILDSLLPGWQDSAAISLIAERQSLVTLTLALIIALLLALLRLLVRWYGKSRLDIRYPGVTTRLRCAIRELVNPAGAPS